MRLIRVSELSTIVAIILLSAVFGLLNPSFLGPNNITAMLRASAYIGIPAIGMALCLISGLIDISIGSLIGLVSCAVSWVMIYGGWNPVAAVGLGLALGAFSSSIGAFAIVKLHLNPFIATIAIMYVLRGSAYAISGGSSIYPLPAGLGELGNIAPFGLSLAFWFMVIIGLAAEFMLNFTVWGLTVRATGSDREVAKCTEVDPDKVNFTTFILLGLLSAITGILVTLRVNGGTATAGMGMEFRAIVACAIGGVSLFGYEGSIVGAVLGVFLTQVIANGLVAIGMPSELQDVALGIILIGVIALDVARQNVKLPIREVKE